MKRHRVGKGRRHPIRIVSSWDAAMRAVDGKVVNDSEGIEGTLRVVKLGHDTRLMHVKTARGKLHPAYLETKRKLRDDWDTDLTTSEHVVPMMEDLGIRFTTGTTHGTEQRMVQRRGGKLRSMRGVRGRT
jgi:hypothetical protein